jgi:hypothetical protein
VVCISVSIVDYSLDFVLVALFPLHSLDKLRRSLCASVCAASALADALSGTYEGFQAKEFRW